MPKKDKNDIFLKMLLEAPTYRVFLRQTFYFLKHDSLTGFSYQKFARQAGFSSKGFIKDVVDGKKRLTHNSLEKFIKGLQLKGSEATLFRMMVHQDDDLSYKSLKADLLQARIASVRQRISTSEKKISQDAIYKKQLWPLLYAAMGSENQGASLSEISSRTKVPLDICAQNIDEMEELGILRKDKTMDRYHCKDFHLIYKGNGEFKGFYLNSLESIKKAAQSSFNDPSNLFIGSILSIKQSRLAEFTEKLKSLTLDFIDEMEDPLGDSIVQLSLGFTRVKYSPVKAYKEFP